MGQEERLIELEEAVDRLSCGLSAMKLMALGLEDIQSPYADGFCALWSYLDEARGEIQQLLEEPSPVKEIA